jgi:hypothetical protein
MIKYRCADADHPAGTVIQSDPPLNLRLKNAPRSVTIYVTPSEYEARWRDMMSEVAQKRRDESAFLEQFAARAPFTAR